MLRRCLMIGDSTLFLTCNGVSDIWMLYFEIYKYMQWNYKKNKKMNENITTV